MKTLAILLMIPGLALGNDMDISELVWLVGCWTTADKSAQEVWVTGGDQSLNGFAVAVGDNRVKFYEVLRIDTTPDGAVVYTAHPSGQEPASFTATEISENRVVFENPQHDYPQVITYSREENLLSARISLTAGGNPSAFDKVACN